MAISITPITLGSATVGTATSVTFEAAGGTSPYIYSVDGPLPQGLDLDSSTGIVSGTPEVAGGYAFLVLVEDATRAVGSVLVEGAIADAGFENHVNFINTGTAAYVAENRTTVTIAAGKSLTVNQNGETLRYVGGDQVSIPTFEVQYLRRDGVIE